MRETPGEVVLLYQDECSIYRQPSQGYLWASMGRRQPKMRYASRANTLMRIVGFLDATTGAMHAWDMKEVTSAHLAECVSQLSKKYPDARRIYLVWDNWPNHKSALVREALEAQPRVSVLWLPTYAPWLNPIEKAWRLLKQHVVHAHPWCDDFLQLRGTVRRKLADLADGSLELLQYVGLST